MSSGQQKKVPLYFLNTNRLRILLAPETQMLRWTDEKKIFYIVFRKIMQDFGIYFFENFVFCLSSEAIRAKYLRVHDNPSLSHD